MQQQPCFAFCWHSGAAQQSSGDGSGERKGGRCLGGEEGGSELRRVGGKDEERERCSVTFAEVCEWVSQLNEMLQACKALRALVEVIHPIP
eukprot:753021-Hanusia_phi.AAC.5